MPTIAVSGSRDPLTLHDEQLIRARLFGWYSYTVQCGDCPTGVDAFVREIVKADWLYVFEADWSKGKQAGPERNARMLEAVDALIAFPGPKSKGTKNAIEQAIAKAIETHVFPIGRERMS